MTQFEYKFFRPHLYNPTFFPVALKLNWRDDEKYEQITLNSLSIWLESGQSQPFSYILEKKPEIKDNSGKWELYKKFEKKYSGRNITRDSSVMSDEYTYEYKNHLEIQKQILLNDHEWQKLLREGFKVSVSQPIESTILLEREIVGTGDNIIVGLDNYILEQLQQTQEERISKLQNFFEEEISRVRSEKNKQLEQMHETNRILQINLGHERSTLKSVQDSYKDLKTSFAQNEKEIENLEAEIDEQFTEICELENLKTALQNRCDDLERTVDIVQGENLKLKTKKSWFS